MSLAQLKRMSSRRHAADLERLDRIAKDPEPVAVMPSPQKLPTRVYYDVRPSGVNEVPVPGFLYWRPTPQPHWPPVLGSPEAAEAKAAAEAEWRRRYGGGAA
jgi:hypothetical protein